MGWEKRCGIFGFKGGRIGSKVEFKTLHGMATNENANVTNSAVVAGCVNAGAGRPDSVMMQNVVWLRSW